MTYFPISNNCFVPYFVIFFIESFPLRCCFPEFTELRRNALYIYIFLGEMSYNATILQAQMKTCLVNVRKFEYEYTLFVRKIFRIKTYNYSNIIQLLLPGTTVTSVVILKDPPWKAVSNLIITILLRARIVQLDSATVT